LPCGLADDDYETMPRVDVVQDDSWSLIEEFFNSHGLVRHQLDSFNTFASITLQQIVDEYNALEFYPKRSSRNNAELGHVRFPFLSCP